MFNTLKKLPWKKLFFLSLALFFIGFFVLLGIYLVITYNYASQSTSHIDLADHEYAALILGAGVRADGSPSSILQDRVRIGVELYKAGKVKKLIMSGDNRFAHYNEPDVMVKLALDLGVPQGDIHADYAGRRTYDSCWRAKHIFSQDRIIIVTQSFHMTRALYICDQVGVRASGVKSDMSQYSSRQWAWWMLRDMISLYKAIIDLYIWPPKVIGGEKITL